MVYYHEVEGKPGLLRTETGEDAFPEGVETRVNEVYRAPLFQIDDIVIRVGKNLHGERNLGEPCTVIFVDKYAKPYHYTVKDPFGQEIGVVETHLMPCEEVMCLADRENAEVVDYDSQRKFPEQQTKEGKFQENGFRVEVVPNEAIKQMPEELEMPVVVAKRKRHGEAPIDDFWANLIEQVCWLVIICIGLFWIWVVTRGPGNTIVPMRNWWSTGEWVTETEQIERMQQEALEEVRKNTSIGNRVRQQLEQVFGNVHKDMQMSARAQRQKRELERRRRNRYGRRRNNVHAKSRDLAGSGADKGNAAHAVIDDDASSTNADVRVVQPTQNRNANPEPQPEHTFNDFR